MTVSKKKKNPYSQSFNPLDDAPRNVVEGPVGTIHFAAPVPTLALLGTRHLTVPPRPAAAAAAAQRSPVAGLRPLPQGQAGHAHQHKRQGHANPRAGAGAGVVGVVHVVVVVGAGGSSSISGIPSRRHLRFFRWEVVSDSSYDGASHDGVAPAV